MATSISLCALLVLATALRYLWTKLSRKKTKVVELSDGAFDPDEKSEGTGDFVREMEDSSRRIVIFYGTQTGTAEEYAIRFAKEVKNRLGLSSLICDPQRYTLSRLADVKPSSIVLFFLATYGDGEPTDNALPFVQYLRRSSLPLDNLTYAIFGLGNRSYEKFNEVAHCVDRLLQKYEANRIGSVGEGDDDKSMEQGYNLWRDSIIRPLAAHLGVDCDGGHGTAAPDFQINELPSSTTRHVFEGELQDQNPQPGTVLASFGPNHPYASAVTQTRELYTNDDDRHCVHLELDLGGSGMTYEHGDHVGVWPVNPECAVNGILQVLGLSEKQHQAVDIVALDPTLTNVPFPAPSTYQAIFRHYLDISTPASRQTLRALADFGPTKKARDQMLRWSTVEEDYERDIVGPVLKLWEALIFASQDCGNPHLVSAWEIPFDRIVSNIPRLRPRYYSISSSPLMYPTSVHVTAVVLRFRSLRSAAHDNQPRWVHGLSSNFLLELHQASSGNGTAAEHIYDLKGPRGLYSLDGEYRVPIHIRSSAFRLPEDQQIPVIMIGPGTGAAPFRAFVQHRVGLVRQARQSHSIVTPWAPMHLFYGCRRADQDFLYRNEWDSYASELDGSFTIHTAFSRGESRKPDGSKIYVQDLLWQSRKMVASLILQSNARVYVCGDAKNMARAVEACLAEILAETLHGRGDVEGVAAVRKMKDDHRYIADVW